MNRVIVLGLVFFFMAICSSMRTMNAAKMRYRCLIQLTNYGGEGAYVIASLVKPDGAYEKTLYVGGDDEEWYPDLPSWFQFYDSNEERIDGITGASIQSGGRKVALLEVDHDKLNSGYKLRFESSVEDGLYHSKDIELDLDEQMIGKTIKGSGYIRYVRVITN
ncbi:MAG: DUF2271 domain-containing protein [Bacteroidota bacterium]